MICKNGTDTELQAQNAYTLDGWQPNEDDSPKLL